MPERHQSNGFPHQALKAMLLGLGQTNAHESWRSQLEELDENSTHEQSLRAFQAVRDAGFLPKVASSYLVSWQLELIVEDRVMEDEEYSGLSAQMAAIERQHGVECLEDWEPAQVPPAYRTLMAKQDSAKNRIRLDTYREFGETQIADLIQSQPAEFLRRFEEGRRFFHNPLPGGQPPQEQ